MVSQLSSTSWSYINYNATFLLPSIRDMVKLRMKCGIARNFARLTEEAEQLDLSREPYE